MHFTDLQPGQTWRSSGRTLTEADLALFAMLSGDRHPIHVDAEYVKGTRFGQRLFHGTFGLVLAVSMSTELPLLLEPVVAATGFAQWKFLRPLFIGDTVHVTVELLSTRVADDGRSGVMERRLSLVKQTGEVAQTGQSGLMVALEVRAAGPERV